MLYLFSQIYIWPSILVTNLVLVSREEFDLLSAVQVPQADCEIVR